MSVIVDRPELSAATGYAVNPLDRMSERRDDAAFIAALQHDPEARTLVLVGDNALLQREGDDFHALYTFDEAKRFGEPREIAFLGHDGTGGIFASQFDPEVGTALHGQGGLTSIDLRSIALQGLVSPKMVGALGQAKSVMYWHAHHRFCANCGAPTRVTAAGWRRECESCGTHHFPRTDPVAIMLATDGDRCLLGRQARFPPGMYSCLAGFIESGETLEDAVRREIKEEAGIITGRITYLASQPWPFPCSLMIGCLAEATSRDLRVDTTELEDARWFTREDARMMLRNAHPAQLFAPPKIAIAHHLLAAWANAG
jgi:NAD+ diphosphatase